MLRLYDAELTSRLLLGTARYPSPSILTEAVKASGAQIVTVSLRRESGGERAGQGFWSIVRDLGVRVLPNTAGCHSVKEAVTTAQMAREVFGTSWVKLEVIGEDETLQPDVFGLVEAARILCKEGFEVFPYTTEDLIVAERLLEAGCRVLMPWGSPIGSGSRPQQSLRPEIAAGPTSRSANGGRRRDRRPIARLSGVGARLRRGAHQHSRLAGARSRRHGRRIRAGGGGGQGGV